MWGGPGRRPGPPYWCEARRPGVRGARPARSSREPLSLTGTRPAWRFYTAGRWVGGWSPASRIATPDGGSGGV